MNVSAKPEITIYGYPTALNVQKVLWFLDELALPFHLEPVGASFQRQTADPDFAEVNPHRLLPVLEIGGRRVWESHTILRCLAALYGGARFWPADPIARAQIEMWMDWSQTVLEFDLNLDFYWAFINGEGDDPALFQRAVETITPLLDRLDAQIARGGFVAGKQFSLADIASGILIHRYMSMTVSKPEFPNVVAWHRSISSRPAFQARVAAPQSA